MKIAVCEDSDYEREKIITLINEYYKTSPGLFTIETFNSGEELLSNFQKNTFNLILLDIYMNQLNGIETAEKIRKLDDYCCIIFITSSLDFSLEAFKVEALDYLIKPVSLESISKCFSRYYKLYGDSSRYLELKEYGIDQYIYISDIIYIEVVGNYCYIHTDNDIYKIRSTLQKLSANLQNLKNLIQCHKSFIINLDKIKQLENNYVIMSNNENIKITRKYSAEFRDLFFNYISSKNRS